MEPTVDLVTARQLEKNIEMILRRQQKYYALYYQTVEMNNILVEFARNTTGCQRNEQHPSDTSWAKITSERGLGVIIIVTHPPHVHSPSIIL